MKYDNDKELFATLIQKYIGIDKNKILEVLKNKNVVDIFKNPNIITNDLETIRRINEIKILRNTYDNLKNYDKNYTINSPEDAKNYFLNYNMDIQDKEYFSVAFLDNQNNIIDCQTSSGTINHINIYTREIVKETLKLNASKLIISHNHPAGDPKPSEADISVTFNIHKACNLIETTLLDHIITSDLKHYSIKEHYNDFDNLSSESIKKKKAIYKIDNKKSIKEKIKKAKIKSEKSKDISKNEIKNIER